MDKFNQTMEALKGRLNAYNAAKETHKQQIVALESDLKAAAAQKAAAAASGSSSDYADSARAEDYLTARVKAVKAEAIAPLFSSADDAVSAVDAYCQAEKEATAPIYAAMAAAWEQIESKMKILEEMRAEATTVLLLLNPHFSVYGRSVHPSIYCPSDTDPVHRLAHDLRELTATGD